MRLKNITFIPAVTPELEFYAKHSQDVDAIYDSEEGHFPCEVQASVKKVCDRACEDAEVLLHCVKTRASEALSHLLILEWKRGKLSEDFYTYAECRDSRKRRSNIVGEMAVFLDVETRFSPRLACVFYPNGGKGKCMELRERLRGIWKKRIWIPKVDPEEWPYWCEPSLVFYTCVLDDKVSLSDCADAAAKTVQDFMTVSVPLIRKLATE